MILVFQSAGDPAAQQAGSTPATGAGPAADRPAASPSNLRLYGFIGLGVGGAALATGAVFGALAAGDKSDLEAGCAGGCPPAFHDQNDSYGTKKTVSSIGLIGGAVLAAAGAVLVFTAPSGDAAATRGQRVRWGGYVAPTGVGVTGAF